MNWALLLAEYPRSLMRDELPILILALLERKGLTTETELMQHVRIEPHRLSAILFDLHRNQFIEFGRNSVRVSNRGKSLIERFDAHSNVIDDFLDGLPLQSKERTAYRLVVRNYRDTAFTQYLNSLCSINTWEYIADQTEPERSEKHTASTNVGKLTLLIRDLRNWFMHTRPPVNQFDNLSDLVRRAITSEELTLTNDSSPASRAVLWLHTLGQSRTELRSNSSTVEPASLVESLRLLDEFQKSWEKNEWFDSWCDASQKLAEKPQTGKHFLVFLSHSLPKGRKGVELQRQLGPGVLGSSYWWIDQPAEKFSHDFLGKLMLASTLDDLSASSGMDKLSLQTTLTQIQEQCSQLLSSVNEARPRREKDNEKP